MMRRFGALVGVLALATAACNTGTTTDGAQAVGVNVDWDDEDLNTAFFAYFPARLTVHPGDTLEFTAADTGEPHTVTFGTKISQAVELAAQYPPPAEPPRAVGHQMEKLTKPFPELLPEGPGDANQTAAQPCFLASGNPPKDGGCDPADQEQPEFTGTESFYNSGWIEPDATFSLTVSADAQPGTYGYFCLLHTLGMTGQVEVVAAGADADTADEVEAAAETEAEEAIGKLQSAVEAVDLPEGSVSAGVVSEDVQHGLVAQFEPAEISVDAGGSVTWTVFGPHTVSFNAPQDATPLLSKAPDGSVHLNPKSVAPAGTQGVAPGPPPKKPVKLGALEGDAFFSSGIILSFPPELVSVKLTFDLAGTYEYACLIHPDMEGTVTVA